MPEQVRPDEAWMQKCPDALPDLTGNTGEHALNAVAAMQKVYFDCADRHNSLVDFERKR